ncbi:MarR family transcriptional regulator, partial [Streptomyces sp. SID5785]|nr:MarR family transcriptional regulator [Streptomyces sp. SID5785]
MHPTDVRALVALMDAARAGRETTAGALGSDLGLNSAGTTALVDRLERAGLARRERDARDRRKVTVVLDARAIALGEEHFGPLIARTLALWATYDERERATVRGFLEGVRDAAG